MRANLFHHVATGDQGWRSGGNRMARLIVAMAVLGLHAIALMVVHAVDRAQAGDAAMVVPHPRECVSIASPGSGGSAESILTASRADNPMGSRGRNRMSPESKLWCPVPFDVTSGRGTVCPHIPDLYVTI